MFLTYRKLGLMFAEEDAMEPAISIWHWLLLLMMIATLIPVARILKRIGLSPWLSLICLIPFVGWVFAWVVAFIRWPIDRATTTDNFS